MAFTLAIYAGNGQMNGPGWPTQNALQVILKEDGTPVSGATISWLVALDFGERGGGYLSYATSSTNGSGIADNYHYGPTFNYLDESYRTFTIRAGYGSVSVDMVVTTFPLGPDGFVAYPLCSLVKPDITYNSLRVRANPSATKSLAVGVQVLCLLGPQQYFFVPNIGMDYVKVGGASAGSFSGGTVLTPSIAAIGEADVVTESATGLSYYTVLVGGMITYDTTLEVAADWEGIYLWSGEAQSGSGGATLSLPLVAYVLSSAGDRWASKTVSWALVTGGSATILTSTTTTDSHGQVNATLQLGATPGTFILRATFGAHTADFHFTVTDPAPSNTISAHAGTPQSANINAAFTNPLEVEVLDSLSAPKSGVTVNFYADPGITLSAASAVTDANGLAHVHATAGASPGVYSVLATIGDSCNFSLTVNSPPSGGGGGDTGGGSGGTGGGEVPISESIQFSESLTITGPTGATPSPNYGGRGYCT